jgi:hypothetical protein
MWLNEAAEKSISKLNLKKLERVNKMYRRLLKLILLVATFGWGISILCVLSPWTLAVAGLHGLGAESIPNDPMLNYWMRMAGGGFFIIGVIFATILVAPKKYAILIPLMAYLSIIEGIILLISGLLIGLPPFPFWGDTTFCLGVGIGLLVIYPRAKREEK